RKRRHPQGRSNGRETECEEFPMSAMVEKALWFIEHAYGEEITLDDVAGHVGVSRYHLSRGFPLAVGMSISAYLRGRRLTEAARALAAGAPDILAVALDACYSSHEAFTRAFREQFGMTPEQVRARGSTTGLALVERIRFDSSHVIELAPPRTVEGRTLTVAGLAERHGIDRPEEVPAQWQRFRRYLGSIPHMTGSASYGIVMDQFFGSETFQYVNGVEVTAVHDLPPELTALRLPAQRYAAFSHPGHVSRMR